MGGETYTQDWVAGDTQKNIFKHLAFIKMNAQP